MSSATPADVLARRCQLTLSGDADGLADLYAPDAVIESVFAGPPGMPARLESREAIRQNARQVMAPLRVENYEVATLYRTQDAEVVIAAMRIPGFCRRDRGAASGTLTWIPERAQRGMVPGAHEIRRGGPSG
jgi:ketosteroid isomerase-like protein